MVVPMFQLLAALFVAAAMAVVLWPIACDGRRALYGSLIAACAVISVGLYRLLGMPEALTAAPPESLPQTLEDGVQQLQAALQRDPQRGDGWALLGRSQLELGQTEQSVSSYQRAVELLPDDATLLTEAAQARAQADPQRRFDDTAVEWLQRARTIAPDAERAGWLLGIAQRQRGDHAGAAQTWESLLPRIDPAAASALREQINIARQAAGQPPLPVATQPTPAASSANALTVTVALDPDFAARVRLDPEATVFVIARAPDGPPMPVAVEKHRMADLPLRVVLDDADSPMPTQKLSDLAEVEVLARMSASGSANRQSNDLESTPVRVRLPANVPVEVVIGAPSP
jgi:cytochrome c-type biogenesis protein CcmH